MYTALTLIILVTDVGHLQLLFNSMLNIRCYFTLFRDLARLYVDIHFKYLEQGLHIQGNISIEERGPEAAKQLQAKQAQLNAYTNENLPKIKDVITDLSVTSDLDPNPANFSRAKLLFVTMCIELYSRDVYNSANKVSST